MLIARKHPGNRPRCQSRGSMWKGDGFIEVLGFCLGTHLKARCHGTEALQLAHMKNNQGREIERFLPGFHLSQLEEMAFFFFFLLLQ